MKKLLQQIKKLKHIILLLKKVKELQGMLDSRKRIQPRIKRMQGKLVQTMAERGYPVIVTSEYRGKSEQNALYAKGRTKPGRIVTNAKFGDSYHNWGVAFDVAFLVNGRASWSNNLPWEMLGAVGEEIGLEWGGRWKSFPDRPHFQYTAKYVLEDFKSGIIDYKRFK